MSHRDWLSSRPVAHRGLHDAEAGIIENTRSAIEAALEAGYAVEVDLQASADNEVMVFHDASLGRLTEAKGSLEKHTAQELRKIRFKGTHDKMMSLEELLALVDGRTPLFLEIKSNWAEVGSLERKIATNLATYAGPVAVMSFDPNSVAVFRKLAPGIPRGIVAQGFRKEKFWGFMSWRQKFRLRHLLHWPMTRPDFVAYGVCDLCSPAPLVARFLFRRPLLTWTVRTESERKRAQIFANNIIFENFRP